MALVLTGLIGLFSESTVTLLSPLLAGSYFAGHSLSYIIGILTGIVCAVQMKADIPAVFGVDIGVWGQVSTGFMAARIGNYLHSAFASKKEKLDDYDPEDIVEHLVARFGIDEEQ